MHTYLTAHAVAEKYGIAVGTLANRRCLGLSPEYVRLPNGRIRYREADIIEWIESGTVAA